MKNQVIEGFQLSPQQKHLWSLCGRDGATIYRSQCVVRVEGPLNKRILRQAIDNVVRRHEILRTSFRSLPGMDVPLQVINPTPAVTIIELDLQQIDASRQGAELDALLENASNRIADCEQRKLFHVDLICLAPELHILQMTVPALCADAVGLDRLVRSIAEAYAACVSDDENTEEPVQYADLSEWQNELLEAEDTRAGREFWRRQDFSALHGLTLPTEKQPALDCVFNPQHFSIVIDAEKAARLASIAEGNGAAMSLVLLTCWQILLWRLGGQSDTMVCAAFDGRKFSELDQALGLFAKYLPVTSRLERQFTFAEALEQVAACVRDVSQWQECFTWAEIDKKYPFSFDFSVLPAAFTCADVSFVIEKRCSYIDRFQVRLSCTQDDRRLSLQFHYDVSLYEEDDVRRLAG
ncbi:MAG TPA: condensation domain-containing protein, partial [Pyrinomonadaceae bacterium]|nr:condensation domain-containing protein [Pyrinomonadaceae bacterium]